MILILVGEGSLICSDKKHRDTGKRAFWSPRKILLDLRKVSLLPECVEPKKRRRQIKSGTSVSFWLYETLVFLVIC